MTVLAAPNPPRRSRAAGSRVATATALSPRAKAMALRAASIGT